MWGLSGSMGPAAYFSILRVIGIWSGEVQLSVGDKLIIPVHMSGDDNLGEFAFGDTIFL